MRPRKFAHAEIDHDNVIRTFDLRALERLALVEDEAGDGSGAVPEGGGVGGAHRESRHGGGRLLGSRPPPCASAARVQMETHALVRAAGGARRADDADELLQLSGRDPVELEPRRARRVAEVQLNVQVGKLVAVVVLEAHLHKRRVWRGGRQIQGEDGLGGAAPAGEGARDGRQRRRRGVRALAWRYEAHRRRGAPVQTVPSLAPGRSWRHHRRRIRLMLHGRV
mmetsp:Transcript_18627/g.40101  ORF Transcript_18627/g.40101 Transcript_18627/m.40101 type:complete len:224 (-) Transcript_18627:825-1496(-)